VGGVGGPVSLGYEEGTWEEGKKNPKGKGCKRREKREKSRVGTIGLYLSLDCGGGF